MTQRNTSRNQQPLPPLQSSRPRLPRGPRPSERGKITTSGPSRPLRANEEQTPARPVSPAAALLMKLIRNTAQQGNPPNGPSQEFSGDRATPPVRYDRDKTRTLTVKEAAYRLKKDTDTVYLWLRMGRLRGWQLGGPRCAVLVCAASVEEVLASTFWSNGVGHPE